jgi:hypothetical protein
MRQRIVIAAIVVAGVCGVLIAAAAFVPRVRLERFLQFEADNDTLILRGVAGKFADAFMRGNNAQVYRMFNSTFRHEVTEPELDTAIRNFLGNRMIVHMLITHAELHGITGQISTDLYFYQPETSSGARESTPGVPVGKEFLFQYWIRTPDGWQLMWLNKVLDPVAMDYGRLDTTSAKEIVELALMQMITSRGMQQQLGLDSTPNLVVLLDHPPKGADYQVTLPGRQVIWLTKDDILKRQQELSIEFYIDIESMRVLKDEALGTFDIIPLVRDPSAPTRTRSLKLLFIRKQGRWTFADYGVSW